MKTKKYFYIITYKLKKISSQRIIDEEIFNFCHRESIDISPEEDTPFERFSKIEEKCVEYWNSSHDATNQWDKLKHYVIFYYQEFYYQEAES